MSTALTGIGVAVTVFGVVLILYIFALKSRFHFTSRLTCPKCGHAWDYRWIPGASFTGVRMWNEREMRCPQCGKWSPFDIKGLRVKESDEPSPSPAPRQPGPS